MSLGSESHGKVARVAIVGAGSVGSTTAYALLLSGAVAESVLIDSGRKLAEGQANDLRDSALFSHTTRILAGDFSDCATADVIVITAGAHQTPNMQSRLDDLKLSALILKDIVSELMRHQPKGILLIASNPVDVLTNAALGWSGPPANRVLGSGTTLDTSCFRRRLGELFGVATDNVHTYVIGEDGGSQVVAISAAHIAGIPLENFCCQRGVSYDPDTLKEMPHDSRTAGPEILATRSTLPGSNRPVSRARTAAQEIAIHRAAAPVHARAVRRKVFRRHRRCHPANRATNPMAYFRETDVSSGTLERACYATRHTDLGPTSRYTVDVGDKSAPRGAWQHIELPAYAKELHGGVAFAWPAMDACYEEDERIMGHAADSYHRIDIRQSSRRLAVRHSDRMVGDTERPLVLYESGFAPRWYVWRDDIDESALTPVEHQTFCPYKGLCSDYDIGDARLAAWSYADASPQVGRISNLVSFEPDVVSVQLDGTQLRLEPGQTVIPHGSDRDLDVPATAVLQS
jgi:malate/lactate dehydrogenase/uncharacterized protein (DUF427 family)